MYLYLCSEDAGGFHTNNSGTDFVVTLPSSYYFSRTESWEIGLVDLYIQTARNTVLTKANATRVLDVYCDSVEPSVYNQRERKILTTTRLKDCTKSIYSPTNIRYVALSQERLSMIHVYLKYHNDVELSLPGLTANCTLHIRRRNID